MNELPEIKGNISVGGRVSYASQQPWVFSGTLKENIISYNKDKYNNGRYADIIQACSLDKVSGMRFYGYVSKPFSQYRVTGQSRCPLILN